MKRTSAWLVFCTLVLLAIPAGFGQSAPVVERPRGEISVFGGGAWINDGVGSHPGFGASAGGYLKRVLFQGEFTYAPLGDMGIWADVPGVKVSGGFHVFEFNGGVHVEFARGSKAVPYVAGGLGIGHVSGSATGTGSYTTISSGGTTTTHFSDTVEGGGGNHFRYNGGFGVKLYAGKKWGFQPEVKAYSYTNDVGSFGLRFTVGIFFDLGK